jgi:glutathione reductase (NADPH)
MGEQMNEVDLFVIGGGSGGVRAARIAAGYGAKVALAEEHRMGGTCVIRGCVPKKLMAYAGRFSAEFGYAAQFGWQLPRDLPFDWAFMKAARDAEVARLEAVYTSTQQKASVRVLAGRARLLDAHTVAVNTAQGEQEFRAKHILVATGSAPWHDFSFPGAELGADSNAIFELPAQPKRVFIYGAGYIALEFASIFAGLGSAVTVAYRGEWPLRGFDGEVVRHLARELAATGIALKPGCTIERITGDASQPTGARQVALSDGSVAEADFVLLATGRRPNTQGLGLEAAGVALAQGGTHHGAVIVNELSQSSVPHIHAVGDVTARVTLTPAAIREGHAFADTVFGNTPRPVDHQLIPTAVFTSPEVGVVGLTEVQATAQVAAHGGLDIYTATFRPMKATMAPAKTNAAGEGVGRTFMKLIVARASQKVLGCHLVGPDSAEMIQVLGIALGMGATKPDFDRTLAVHPTAAEELVTMRTPTRRVG